MTVDRAISLAKLYGSMRQWSRNDNMSFIEAVESGHSTVCLESLAATQTKLELKMLARVKKSASQCKSLLEWRKIDPTNYKQAAYRCWIAAVCSHMSREWESKSYASILRRAKVYHTAVDWMIGNKVDYAYAWRKGWLKKLYAEAPLVQNPGAEYFDVYAYEFESGEAYVGVTRNVKQRHWHHQKDGVVASLKGTPFTLKVLERRIPIERAPAREQHWMNKYSKSFKLLNKARACSLGGGKTKYNLDICVEAAKKCCKLSEFSKRFPGHYTAAYRYGWIASCKSSFQLYEIHQKCD